MGMRKWFLFTASAIVLRIIYYCCYQSQATQALQVCFHVGRGMVDRKLSKVWTHLTNMSL